MKELVTKNKWLGFIAIIVYAAIVAGYMAHTIVPFVKQNMPVVSEEIKSFLPVTFENGKIVAPQNVVISKSYDVGGDKIQVVMNTGIDEFETSDLKDSGLYISRKYFYAVSERKTEIQSFEKLQMPNMVVDSEIVDLAATEIEKNVSKYIFAGTFLAFLIFSAFAVLLYTLFMHWIIRIWFKIGFTQTLFVNSVAYVVLSLLSLLTPFNIGIIVMFVALIAANVGVNSAIKEENA